MTQVAEETFESLLSGNQLKRLITAERVIAVRIVKNKIDADPKKDFWELYRKREGNGLFWETCDLIYSEEPKVPKPLQSTLDKQILPLLRKEETKAPTRSSEAPKEEQKRGPAKAIPVPENSRKPARAIPAPE